MSKTLKEKLIQSLIDSKQLNQGDLEDAMVMQKKRGIGLDKALIDKGLITEKEVLMLLVRELNIPFINLNKYKIDPGLQEYIPERIARQYNIIPLSVLEHTMTVAISDPLNVFVIDDIKSITGRDVEVMMSTNTEILKAIDNYYGVPDSMDVSEISKDFGVEDFEIISEETDEGTDDEVLGQSEEAPIIRMVNLVVKEAIKQRASDIHIEPQVDGMRVRYRIDGVLRDILEIPSENQNAVIVRIKIMSRLDITANYIPQDGRFKMKIGNKEVDFRVSLLPTTFGQKIVMRVLDKGNLSVGLEGLGVNPENLAKMKEAIKSPFGMVLVTGPTGSGKSTTLYSIINELNSVERNIVTVEDPVEYLIEGLTQIQARPDIGLTFAEGLKSILRQSPDIVMVGEIRDGETADIAIKAALTGQMVFSTLHTNDAAGALTRLVDMGVEPFLVASSLVMATAQRLCRKICPQCRVEDKVLQSAIDDLDYKFKKEPHFFKGTGCDNCRNTGYKGRTSLTEVLFVDDEIRTMLLQGASSDAIKNYARESLGMTTLYDDAMIKAGSGETSLEEVLRVTSKE